MKIDGVIILNKPAGMNSMKAVKKVQYALGAEKAGHLGTLDPLGTGVLPIALGKGTKLFEKHLLAKKIYRAVFKFGIETDTFDSEGKVVNQDDVTITLEQINSVLMNFIGVQEQMPPRYSAKKINGKKAYELARKDCDFELKTKTIQIFRFEVLAELEKNTFLFEIECSSGTYIRSCCRDLAKLLNTCACMVAIIRLKSGSFEISKSVTLDELTINDVISLEGIYGSD